MMRSNVVLILFAVFVDGVFGDTEAVKSVSVMEGDHVPLYAVTKQRNETMQWYFKDTLIAVINGEASKSCLYYGVGGIFRDRLEVDYETGSLTITDIRPQHAGRYEAKLIRSDSSGKSESLNRPSKCDSTKITTKNSNSDIIKRLSLTVSGSGLSPAAVAGIVVAVVVVVLLVAAAVVVGRRKMTEIFRNVKEKPTSETQVSNDEIQNEKSLMI